MKEHRVLIAVCHQSPVHSCRLETRLIRRQEGGNDNPELGKQRPRAFDCAKKQRKERATTFFFSSSLKPVNTEKAYRRQTLEGRKQATECMMGEVCCWKEGATKDGEQKTVKKGSLSLIYITQIESDGNKKSSGIPSILGKREIIYYFSGRYSNICSPIYLQQQTGAVGINFTFDDCGKSQSRLEREYRSSRNGCDRRIKSSNPLEKMYWEVGICIFDDKIK